MGSSEYPEAIIVAEGKLMESQGSPSAKLKFPNVDYLFFTLLGLFGGVNEAALSRTRLGFLCHDNHRGPSGSMVAVLFKLRVT